MIWRRLCEIFSSVAAGRKVLKMLSMLLMPRPRPPCPAEMILYPMMLKMPKPHIVNALRELLYAHQSSKVSLESVVRVGTVRNNLSNFRDGWNFIVATAPCDVPSRRRHGGVCRRSCKVAARNRASLYYTAKLHQTAKMDDDHDPPTSSSSSEEDEEIGEIIILSDEDELLSNSSSPARNVMPCTSSSDARPRYRRARPIDPDDRPESSDGATSDGEYGDAEDEATNENQLKGLTVTFKSDETNEEVGTAKLIVKRQDTVDEFMTFVEAIIRSMQSEQVKKSLMNEISDILIVAKTDEIKSYRRLRLQ